VTSRGETRGLTAPRRASISTATAVLGSAFDITDRLRSNGRFAKARKRLARWWTPYRILFSACGETARSWIFKGAKDAALSIRTSELLGKGAAGAGTATLQNQRVITWSDIANRRGGTLRLSVSIARAGAGFEARVTVCAQMKSWPSSGMSTERKRLEEEVREISARESTPHGK